ncbi:MAG: four helix bundle protein [Bacteroidota bacterium]
MAEKTGYKHWAAYSKGMQLATLIQELSFRFPKEEKYSLTDQIRRSSRSVCANLAECYGKRRYIRHFRSKLTDAVSENFETQTWLYFALTFGYISEQAHRESISLAIEVGKLLTYMEFNPQRYLAKPFPDQKR